MGLWNEEVGQLKYCCWSFHETLRKALLVKISLLVLGS